MRGLACLFCLMAALTGRAADDWQTAFARMPLKGNVNELNTSNYAGALLGAFASNGAVKALILMPGAVDTFFWHRETRVILTNTTPSLLDAVVALTNQTRIRATYEPPFLLLRFDWDPVQPLCEVKDGAAIENLRQRLIAYSAVFADKDWDFTLAGLKKAAGMTILPKVHSRYSYHFYRSTFAATDLSAWEAVEAISLSTRTKISVEKRRIIFKEDARTNE